MTEEIARRIYLFSVAALSIVILSLMAWLLWLQVQPVDKPEIWADKRRPGIVCYMYRAEIECLR